jgi:hypothetical protein
MGQILHGGLPKWNTISISIELLMTYTNYMWVSYIWMSNASNGGNGIRNLIKATLHGPNLCKYFLLVLSVILTAWDA